MTPQGTMGSDGNAGWINTNGTDIAFTKAMLISVQDNYCVDDARIFSVGFSCGGMMSFAVGCEMGDVFRAIAPMSCSPYSDFNCSGTKHAVAMWGSHGMSDNVVPIPDGRAARDKILKQNHCGTTGAVKVDRGAGVGGRGGAFGAFKARGGSPSREKSFPLRVEVADECSAFEDRGVGISLCCCRYQSLLLLSQVCMA